MWQKYVRLANNGWIFICNECLKNKEEAFDYFDKEKWKGCPKIPKFPLTNAPKKP